MQALQCDICGGKLAMDVSGEFAVCESCGMKHTKDRMKQKVQEIKGTVKVEGPVKVEGISSANDFLVKARQMVNKNETAKAASFYQKVLEIEPLNEEADRYIINYENKEKIWKFINLDNMFSGFERYDHYKETIKNIPDHIELLNKCLDEYKQKAQNSEILSEKEFANQFFKNEFHIFIRYKDTQDYADLCLKYVDKLQIEVDWFNDDAILYCNLKISELSSKVINKNEALEQALRLQKFNMVELMLNIGADPNMEFSIGYKMKRGNYKTAIKHNIKKEEQDKYIELFQKYGAKQGWF